MSINKVTAELNGSSYKLNSTEQESEYSTSITAPESSSDYNVRISAVDDAGNETVIDSTDQKYKDILTLKVKPVIDPNEPRNGILTNELGNRMIDMVSPIYNKSYVALWVFQALGTVLSKEKDFVDGDFISQIFPQTATWGLKYWEDEYGIIPDESKKLEQRRAYLMSVMFKKRPMTPARIKQIAKGITGMDCDVFENYEPNTIMITVRGYFRDSIMVKKEFDRKLPAHLNYILRMAELLEIDIESSSLFCVTECERYELEVLN